jgi:hypothetical protein
LLPLVTTLERGFDVKSEFRRLAASVLLVILLLPLGAAAQGVRWSESQANHWYAQQPWLVGSNYVPSNAINQLEMWQEDTFDPMRIDQELAWAEGLGMNTMRVFLHDLLWAQDAPGFKRRIDAFLTIADRHHIHPILVLFDSCWDPAPKLGPQHPPIPGVHNSGWVQSPGPAAVADPAQRERLRQYVQGVLGAFGRDHRVIAWDLWNEPANMPAVIALLPQVFEWARAANPEQPLTSGVFNVDQEPAGLETPSEVTRIQVAQSDILSFHSYGWPEVFEAVVTELEKYHRPILCTEFMARSIGSTFDTILPIARQHRVAAINWGLVTGKTQTNLPWSSWAHPYVSGPPEVWFHDVLKADGSPYRTHEAELLRSFTAQAAKAHTHDK